METKKQLISLLGMSFMQMLCTDSVQAMHEDYQQRKLRSLEKLKNDLDAGAVIIRPYRMQPCFGEDGKLSYINIPLQATS